MSKDLTASSGTLHRIPYPNNMGVVRYFLALAVVIAHFNILTGHRFYFPISSYSAVGGFFALSGFLIYSSYEKRPCLRTYIWARCRRLLPAYFITVVGFAVGLCFLSSCDLSSYFFSAHFARYMAANLTFLNFIEPTLPGVFNDFDIPAVNGSLWTMKVEWALYLSMPFFYIFLRRYGRHPIRVFGAVILFAIAYRLWFHYMCQRTGSEFYHILGKQFLGQFAYFYTGALCYRLLPLFLRFRWQLFAGASIICFLSPFIPYYNLVVQPVTLSVLVIWFSIIGKWGTWEGKRDNLSYNLYLVHFPVIQAFVALGGLSLLSDGFSLAVCLGVALVISYIILLGERGIQKILLQ